MPDNVIVDRSARLLSRTKTEPADSFRLHAPLELLARATLLARARPDDADPIREAIAALGDAYAASAPDRPAIDIPDDLLGPTRLTAAVTGGLRDGEPDVAEEAMLRMCIEVDGTNLVRFLAPAVLPLAGAAAHAPIGLQLLSRIQDTRLKRAALVPTIRTLAGQPEQRVTMTLEELPEPEAVEDHDATTAAVLHSIPDLDRPDRAFIWPQIDTAQNDPEARAAIGALARRIDADPLGVLAACQRTMLDETDDEVPYGWTHGLTIPYAAIEVGVATGHPDLGVLTAATAIVAFRACLGATEPQWDDLGAPPVGSLGRWSDAEVPELVAVAGAHPDAHVAKYTLACIELSEADHPRAALHLAAAGRLLDWWDRHG